MSYEDYGISKDKALELKEKCRTLHENEKLLLWECCAVANNDLKYFLYHSLINNLSYDKIYVRSYVPITKDDFYAYRRKALCLFNQELAKKIYIIV